MGHELALSFVFIFLAFLPTQKNSKYILSGYNTMTEADRKQVNLTGLLDAFKRFHIFVGISILVVCTILRQFSDSAADVFLISYVIASYSYLTIISEKFYQLSPVQKTFNRIIAAILVVVSLTILYFSVISFRNSELLIDKNQIEITGIYGLRIVRQEIDEIKLINALPEITSKTNGFNGGSFRKGRFSTKRWSENPPFRKPQFNLLSVDQNPGWRHLLQFRSG